MKGIEIDKSCKKANQRTRKKIDSVVKMLEKHEISSAKIFCRDESIIKQTKKGKTLPLLIVLITNFLEFKRLVEKLNAKIEEKNFSDGFISCVERSFVYKGVEVVNLGIY